MSGVSEKSNLWNLEIYQMPSNKEWGPSLWTILHIMAEKLGKQPVELLASDEAREIVFILRLTEHIMPCEKCRKHYKEYLKKNPIDDFKDRRGEFLRQAVRLWIWKLHNTVNESNAQPSFPVDELTNHYQRMDIGHAVKEFYPVINRSIALGLLASEPFKSFRRHCSLLRALLGI